jgi:hypothetical protein
MNIMSNLPNDIIINILKERRIMKQSDKYKKNYNFVIKEIKTLDKKCWGNLIKIYYEKTVHCSKRILEQIKYKKCLERNNKIILIDEISEIFDSVYFLNDNTINPKLILEHIEYLDIGGYYD